jgi:hypothetical protein
MARTIKESENPGRPFEPNPRLLVIEAMMFAGIAVMGGAVTYEIVNASKAPEPRAALVVPGMIEAEMLPVVGKTGEFTVAPQDTSSFPHGEWSGEQQLFVSTRAPGQSISLRLPDRDAGSYHLTGYFTKSYDYGIVQVLVNDQKAGETIDLWSYAIESTGPISLGVVTLGGENDVIRIGVVGRNEQSSAPFYQFGIDGFTLLPDH